MKGCFRAKQRQTPLFLSSFLPAHGSSDLSLISGNEKSLFFFFSADLKSSPTLFSQGNFQ